MDQKFTPIGEIPFPAVTFCGRFAMENETQFEYNSVMEKLINEGIGGLESDYLDIFELASGMCYETLRSSEKKNISNLFRNRNNSFGRTIENMFKINITDYVTKCQGIESPGIWPCLRGFVKILTRNGLCLSFNMLRRGEIVRDDV